jgi:dTDP-4-dehydrorhamnose 3,5-epimerase-like enzyme
MAQIYNLPRFIDQRGSLTVIDNMEEVFPFPVKRIFYINAATDAKRGGHRHRITRQAVICIQGSCVVSNSDGKQREHFTLDNPGKYLILETSDWHIMHSFAINTILLVFASEPYDPQDYIYEPYKMVLNDSL